MIESNADTAGKSLSLSGFQLKGTSKRRKINSDYGIEVEVREAVLGIEKGIIKPVNEAKIDNSHHLVIPLPPSRQDILRASSSKSASSEVEAGKHDTTKIVSPLPRSLDEQAAQELIAEMSGVTEAISTNLLSIPLSSDSLVPNKRAEQKTKSAPLLAASLAPELIGLANDDERFKADINTRPEDLNVRSDAYKLVRIEDFGAAMLRGMGWSGEKEEKKEEEKLVARDARLGLGALSRPPDDKKKGNKEEDKKRKKEWDKKANDKLKKQVLNEGDHVWLRDVTLAGKRATVVAVRGVPGLDRIRIRLELTGKIVEIKRTDAVQLTEEELQSNPYRESNSTDLDNATSTSTSVQFFGLRPTGGNFETQQEKVQKREAEKGEIEHDKKGEREKKVSDNPNNERDDKGEDRDNEMNSDRYRKANDRNRTDEEGRRDGKREKSDDKRNNDDHAHDRNQMREGEDRRREERGREKERGRDERGSDERKRGSEKDRSDRTSYNREDRKDGGEKKDENYRDRGRGSDRDRDDKKREKKNDDRDQDEHRTNRSDERDREKERERNREGKRDDDERSNNNSKLDRHNKNSDYHNNDSDKNKNTDKNKESDTNKNDYSSNKKQIEIESKKVSSWLINSIRVRDVSKKSRTYLQKGFIVDIPCVGMATVKMDNGQTVEGIKEKYLETVLPAIGGSCTVLRGTYKGESAVLLEKRKENSLVFIQLKENLEGVLVSMDDIAANS